MDDLYKIKQEENLDDDYDPESDYRRKVLFVVASILGIVFFFWLYRYPWFTYILVLYGYSVYLFGDVFCRSKYSLRQRWAQNTLVDFLPIHLLFLLLILAGHYEGMRVLPHLPSFLTTSGRRNPPPYIFLLMIVLSMIFLIENRILINRLNAARPISKEDVLDKA